LVIIVIKGERRKKGGGTCGLEASRREDKGLIIGLFADRDGRLKVVPPPNWGPTKTEQGKGTGGKRKWA